MIVPPPSPGFPFDRPSHLPPCAGDPRGREGALLALRDPPLAVRGQRRREGGEDAADALAGGVLSRGAPDRTAPPLPPRPSQNPLLLV